MIGHQNIDLDQFCGHDASVFEFSSSMEPILRLSINDYDDAEDDGWVLSFLGVKEVEMKPSWEINRLTIEIISPDVIACVDESNGFRILCSDIALIPEDEPC